MAALLLCSLSGTVASAQDDEAVEDEAIAEEAEGAVVITATRIESDPAKIGSSVTVITAEDLKAKQHRSVVDALRDVPGVVIRRSGGVGSQTSIFMRGTDSDHTLLMIDGIQVHDVSSPNGTAVLDHLTVDSIDRIEIVRGPQSSLYGSDAIGGVINVITKKGAGKPQFFLSTEAGSYQTFIERIGSSGGFEKFNYSVSASRIDRGGFSQTSGDTEDDRYGNTTLISRLGFEPTENFGVDVFLRHIDAKLDIDSGSDPTLSKTDSEQFMFKVAPRLSLFDGRWEQTLSVWMHDIDRENKGEGFVLPSDFEGRIFGVDWQHNVRVHEKNTITLGMELERQDATNDVVGFPRIDADTHNLGFYLQDNFQIGEKFSATLGFRADEHEEFGSSVTYRGTAAYDMKEINTIFRASVGSGFKAPSLVELFDTTFGSANPDLEAEESFGFDLGVEQSFLEDDLVFGVTYFRNEIDDMIVAVFDPATFAFPNVNIEKVVTQGVEAFASYRPIENLRIRLHYTFTDTEAREAASFGISEGSQLLRRPNHKVGLDTNYRFYDDRAQVNLDLLYVDDWKDLDPVTFATVDADGYFLVNLAASFQVREYMEIFGRLDNVLDEDYEEVLGFNTPGFSVFGGMRFQF